MATLEKLEAKQTANTGYNKGFYESAKANEANDKDIGLLARMIYGEGAGEDYNTMHVIGSSAINRLNANRPKEFGINLQDVLKKGYYAVRMQNDPYKQALSGKFTDDISKAKWDMANQVARGLITGELPPLPAMFYFTDEEIEKLSKKNRFDFNQVKPTGAVGKYKTYTY